MFDFILATKDNPREAFRIGSLSVEWYGLIIVIGMIVGLAYACWQSKKVGLTPDDIIELFLWLIPLAIVFARLLYVLPLGKICQHHRNLEGRHHHHRRIARRSYRGGVFLAQA